jgi:hypothetical protein
MDWLKNKLKLWLGIHQIEKNILDQQNQINRLFKLNKDLVHIGVDVHFKSPHMILIYSKLAGGQLYHVDVNFESLIELRNFVMMLKEKYNTDKVICDTPPGYDSYGILRRDF